LGIADVLARGPRTSVELASVTDADAGSLHRLLRALTALGLCAELDDGRFQLTALGHHLRSGIAGSVRSFAMHWGGSMWPLWGGLLHRVRTGKNARSLLTRQDSFETLGQNSEAVRVVSEAMAEVSRLLARGLIRCYDFSGFRCVVDVGGGRGELLEAILRATPGLHGVLFDRPLVVEDARRRLEAAGLTGRCEVVSGSFFDAVPQGADVYLLKSVLHDWDDDRAATILANCRRAVAGDGRLLVVERVLPESMRPCSGHRFLAASDLGMMVAVGGRERTEAEFRTLFQASGFVVTRIADAGVHYSLIEARCE